jgi:DNA modification methylase
MDELLNKNLNNIKSEVDLFGQKEDKLSMRDRIGFLPISIWEPDWNIVNRLKSVVGDIGEKRELQEGSSKNLSYKSNMGSNQSNVSIFNPHLAQMILSAYCPPNAKIYDPFAGGGTRGFIATAMGHDYWGVELRQEEVDRINSAMFTLDKHFHLTCGDSRTYPHCENWFDFCYTCPPYYNLEIYSKLPNDLSAQPSYKFFLSMLQECIVGVYKGLKHGCLSVFVVGNFRNEKGYLVHFNGDVIKLSQEVGFVLHDELIFWGASKCASQRCGQFEANRKSVRVHEYIVILKKP